VTVGGVALRHYDYDANGNRTRVVDSSGAVIGHYDDQDRLTQYCAEDASGNPAPGQGLPCFGYIFGASGDLQSKIDLASGEATGFVYDQMGTLRTVNFSDGRMIEYEIDAAGRRVGKYVDGMKQWGLLYQGGLAPIAQLDPDNNVVSVFVYGTRRNVPDYMVRQGTIYRFVVDHVGSVLMVVNTATGEVVEQAAYDEFGQVVADSNPGFQPFGFAGGVYDPDTGLVLFGARDYDPVTGRWTAKDPILFGGRQANLYLYSFGDPINFVDPTGTDALLDFANWLDTSGGMDLSQGIRSYGEGVGVALAHEAANLGAFGPQSERYAENVNAVIGLAATAALYNPDCVNYLAKKEWDEHKPFLGGRLLFGLTIEFSPLSPLALPLSFLSSYGITVHAAESGAPYMGLVRNQLGGVDPWQ
jgi:RHS repeat-associated protein